METITEAQVRKALDLFNMRLSPSQQKTDEELDLLGAMILDDLLEEHWTSERFANACRKHRKLSSWLPTTADLLAADKALAEATPCRELPALPLGDSAFEAQLERNKARVRDLLDALAAGKRPPWARDDREPPHSGRLQ